ncbi:ankyrin repeat-containing domain protein [Xylariaceae sp. FL1272]|nr:ankyrin repeat-containing domain protein [Xylariaceae sp. FL1272]
MDRLCRLDQGGTLIFQETDYIAQLWQATNYRRSTATSSLKIIIEQLVLALGVRKSVRLRTVCKTWNDLIQNAICCDQIVPFNHPAAYIEDLVTGDIAAGKLLFESSYATRDSLLKVRVVAHTIAALEDVFVLNNRRLPETCKFDIAQAVATANNYNVERRARDSGIRDPQQISSLNTLCAACVIGHLGLVIKVVESQLPFAGVDAWINMTNPFFGRPLHVAAAWGHIEIVQYLLDSGARPDICGEYVDRSLQGQRPWASNDVLEARHKDLVCRNTRGSALRAAILGCNRETIQCLMDHSLQIHPTQREYLYMMIAAASRGRDDIVLRLTPTNGYLLPIMRTLVAAMMKAAIDQNMINMVQYLINEYWYMRQHPPDRPVQFDVVRHACRRGRYQIAWTILAHQDRCQAWNRNEVERLLHEAAYSGYDELTRFLISEPWIQPRIKGPVIALLSAVKGGQARIVEYLFQCAPVLDIFQNRPERLLSIGLPELQCHGERYALNVGEDALIKAAEIKNPRLSTAPDYQSKGANIERFFEIARKDSMIWSQPWLLDIIKSLSPNPNPIGGWTNWWKNYGLPEDQIKRQPQERGVYLTRETYDWHGKY